MSAKVVWHLAGAIRDAGFFNKGIGFFLLQLLAWDKLDREGKLPSDFSLTQAAQQLEVKEYISSAFDYLSNEEVLRDNAAAFKAEQNIFQSLSESDFRSLIHVVLAVRGQSLDYHEAIEFSLRSYGLNDPYNIIPDEVADLIVRLAEVRSTDSVYCPFEGAYRLAEWSNRITRDVYIETKIVSPLPFLMNILLDGSIRVHFSDPIMQPGWTENRRLKLFDVSVANPPFSVRYKQETLFDLYERFPEKTLYGEVLHIRHVLAQTRRRAVVVVPNSILFRTAAGERQFKVDLLQSGILEAVIELPASMLTTTNISFSVLVLNKEHRYNSVFFIDASSEHFFEAKKGRGSLDTGRRTLKNIEEIVHLFERREASKFSQMVNQTDCAANDYNLVPARYVATGQQLKLDQLLRDNSLVALDDIAEIMRPQYLKEDAVIDGQEVLEVSVSDIGDDGYVHSPQKNVTVSEKALAKVKNQILQPGDILLASKGSVGKVGMVPSNIEGIWLANQSFQVLRLRPNKHITDPVVLFRYLASPAAQALIHARTGGSGVRMIQTRDVKALPVIVPTPKEQAAIVNEHNKIMSLYKEIARLQAEAENLSKNRWNV